MYNIIYTYNSMLFQRNKTPSASGNVWKRPCLEPSPCSNVDCTLDRCRQTFVELYLEKRGVNRKPQQKSGRHETNLEFLIKRLCTYDSFVASNDFSETSNRRILFLQIFREQNPSTLLIWMRFLATCIFGFYIIHSGTACQRTSSWRWHMETTICHIFIIYSSYIHHIFIIYSSYIHLQVRVTSTCSSPFLPVQFNGGRVFFHHLGFPQWFFLFGGFLK